MPFARFYNGLAVKGRDRSKARASLAAAGASSGAQNLCNFAAGA